MPATAGRVRMPANNRVHSSAALQTHGIWQSAIGYDPYAPSKDDTKDVSQPKPEGDPENAYASFRGLLELARITGSNSDEARGACKRCGRVGHLTFQCKNFVSLKEEEKERDGGDADIMADLKRIRSSAGKMRGKKDESEESSDLDEEIELSDSSEDSEMERIIAERFGKKSGSGSKSKSVKKKKKSASDGEDSDGGRKEKRGRSKKRRSGKRSPSVSDDEDDGKRRRRKEKRRKRDESSDEEEEERRRRRKSRKERRRRRSHRHSDDSDDESDESPKRHKRKSRRARSSSVSDSDDSRVGRSSKRSDKKSRKRNHEDDE